MASPFREMLYWFGKIIDRKLPHVNTNGWIRRRGAKNGVCLNCLDECNLYPCDNCGLKHKCGNCILSECFLNPQNEFNKCRWLVFEHDPDDSILLQAWIKYKDYFLFKFNYDYPNQAKILDMNKNQKFQTNEGRKKALSVPITTQYLKFKFFGKTYIQFGTITTTKLQPWIELSELQVGYLQLLNVERCAKLMVTKSLYASNTMKASCIKKMKSKRPIFEDDCAVEAYLDKDEHGWKFAAVVGRKKVRVTQKLAMNYFTRAINSELLYYAHSRCHVLSNCPRWGDDLRLFHVSTLDIVFKMQFMKELAEWFQYFSQYTGSHYDFITECVHDDAAITIFRKEIEDYITDGKPISLNSVLTEEHAAHRYVLILRKSLMSAIDDTLAKIRSQSMGVL
uniref:Nonstructural RNA-binding protein 1 n=1 Tax=Rotavirus C TaxID=36427 RepID=A0A5Q2V4K0_9REOV|nr:nonstructural RNA-binding protein 1 [Rotavirus C]